MKEIIHLLKSNNLLVSQNNIESTQIKGFTSDSREVKNGYAFICIKGFNYDGHNYINQAIKNKASLIVTQKQINIDMPFIQVNDTRKASAIFAKVLYDNPSSKFKLIGVTGTNGKTTTAWLIQQLLQNAGYKAGLIGTLGYKINNVLTPLERTTPDVIELNKILNKMVENNIEFVIMEVSSHAVSLDRIYGLEFDLGIFLNLSRDHLDFHANMQDYFNAKLEFLKRCSQTLVNTKNEWGKQAFNSLANSKSFFAKNSNYPCELLVSSISGTSFTLNKQKFKTQLIGGFNLENLLAAILACSSYIKEENMFNLVLQLKHAQGRMEVYKNCVIDYAHTPDALKSVLQTLNKLKTNRVITVCGAGGNRDKGKRPIMGKVACENSDCVIFTNDNPRDEKPEDIIFDVTKNCISFENWWVITDRSEAIKAAIQIATDDDIILIAGKGHENYQEVLGVRHRFNDLQKAKQFICEKQVVNNLPTNSTIKLDLPIDFLFLQLLFNQKCDLESKLLRYISTDSRTIKPNSLFIALKGENFDANKFVNGILKDDSNAAIVCDKNKISKDTIYVHDCLKAYQLLSRRYSKMFGTKKIAITGSYGKTSTKDFLANILTSYGVLKTYKNENNQVGVPKTIFRLNSGYKYAVIEMGTNTKGEITAETFATCPDYAIITSYGECHLKNLINIDGVKAEKNSLLKSNSLKAYIKPEADDSYKIEEQNKAYFFKPVVRQSKKIKIDEKEFFVNTDIDYMAKNASLAAKMAKILNIDNESINNGLSLDITSFGRMQKLIIDEKIIIADYYNANPSSMKAAINYFYSFKPKYKHYAVLGDMLELGIKEVYYHKQISKLLTNEQKINLYTVGDLAKYYGGSNNYKSVDELIKTKFFVNLPAKCVLLLKASRGVHLEKIIKDY